MTRMLAVAVVAAIVMLVLVWLGQRWLIYLPAGKVPAPSDVGLPHAEQIAFGTADGLRLRAWYVPAAGETLGAVLVLPGNAGNRASRAPLAAALRRAGLATLLVDYRGYGGNPGRPSQEGLLTDARAAADALQRTSGLGSDQTAYFGESLGAAVAAGLAAERPPAGLILRSPFPSLARVGRLHYPWLPVRTLLRDRFPTAEWVAQYEGPTLVLLGDADTIVPPELSRAVARAAGGETEVVTIPDAGHNDRALLDGAQMLDRVTGFIHDRVEDRG